MSRVDLFSYIVETIFYMTTALHFHKTFFGGTNSVFYQLYNISPENDIIIFDVTQNQNNITGICARP